MFNLVSTILSQDNTLNYTVHIFNDPMRFNSRVIIQYKLNGVDDMIEVDLPDQYDCDRMDIRDLAQVINKAVLEKFSQKFTIEILEQMMERFMIKRRGV